MNALVPQKDLTEILDRIIREITLLAAGVRLFPDTAEPESESYTVYIVLEKGFHAPLSLRTENPLLIRMAQYMIQAEDIKRTQQSLLFGGGFVGTPPCRGPSFLGKPAFLLSCAY